MTDREGWQSQQGYAQQYPQEQPWQAQQYDPAAHRQRLGAGPQQQETWQQPQEPWQQYPPQQPPYGYQQPQYPPPGPPQQAPQRRRRHPVRNILVGVGALVGVIIVISVAASGGGHTVNTTGTTAEATSTATPTATGASPAGSPAPKTAGIGSAITLAGYDSSEQMSVTLVKVIGSASPDSSGFDDAPSGDRYYAAQFRLADSGSAAYSDSPSNGAEVVDSAGQSYQASITDTVNGCVSFPATENVAPGSSGLGASSSRCRNRRKSSRSSSPSTRGWGRRRGSGTSGKHRNAVAPGAPPGAYRGAVKVAC